VLDWVAMFDSDRSVLAFLDHARKRFRRYPDAKVPVPAERYMKFPSEKLADVKDTGSAPLILERHPSGQSCPAKPLLPRGTVLTRLFGRALDKDGKPVADTIRQEHYVEDRFHISITLQQALVRAAAAAGDKRFPIPNDLARLLVSHAYLGQLDVNPVAAPGGKGDLRHCRFWAWKVGPSRFRVEGRSEALGASDREGDGRLWKHEVKLDWEGLIEVQGERITRLLLVARGAEKLRWGNKQADLFTQQVDVARLPAGHAIDLACNVRYGLIGEPIPAAEATDGPIKDLPTLITSVPEEARRQLVEAFGPMFLVFHDKVQKELALAADQQEKVEARLVEMLQEAMQFFKTLEGLEQPQREKRFVPFRQKFQEQLAAFLRKTLAVKQRERLRQLELQREGPFALLGRPDVAKELKISDEQRKQFMAVVASLEQRMRALMREGNDNPREVFPKMMKIRKAHESKIEAILSAAQRKQWKGMLGKPFTWED
jgi:hypothetical protein